MADDGLMAQAGCSRAPDGQRCVQLVALALSTSIGGDRGKKGRLRRIVNLIGGLSTGGHKVGNPLTRFVGQRVGACLFDLFCDRGYFSLDLILRKRQITKAQLINRPFPSDGRRRGRRPKP
jgi:hypothetical protein